MDIREIEAEALRRWPIVYTPARNANQRQTNLVNAAIRQGFIEGTQWARTQSSH